MRLVSSLFVLSMCLLPIISHANDLGDLPTDHQGFENKLKAFMVPGSPLKNAVDLLERNDFRCFDNTALGQVYYCVHRSGGAMGSTETTHEVWLEYDQGKKIIEVITGVTILPGVTELLIN